MEGCCVGEGEEVEEVEDGWKSDSVLGHPCQIFKAHSHS